MFLHRSFHQAMKVHVIFDGNEFIYSNRCNRQHLMFVHINRFTSVSVETIVN